MPTPLVSIVMPVFNAGSFLPEAVESILRQTFKDFEFIVINDGSTDDSASILESYSRADSRLRVCYQENQGNYVVALNRGCALANGKYIARMDADDVAVPDRLQHQVEFLETHPEVGILGGAVEFIDTTGRVVGTSRHPADDAAIRCALRQAVASFCHPATIMRSSVFHSAGGYRTPFVSAEDYDLWLRIAERSQLANLDRVVLKYRLHPNQVSRRQLGQQRLSILCAQELALAGRIDDNDAVEANSIVSPVTLDLLGVSRERQQRAVFAGYHISVCSLALASYTSPALKVAEDAFIFSRWEYVEESQIAELLITTASLYRREGRILRSLIYIARALAMKPSLSLRPLRRIFVQEKRTRTRSAHKRE